VAHDYSDFEAFAVAAMPRLRRLAYAACRDHHQADDVVQGALERVFAAWPRVRRVEDPFAYTRTTLIRKLISEQRRPWFRREVLHEAPPEQLHSATDADARLDLVQLVRQLPPRQRLVVLLRFVEDLSIAQVADLLGCTQGTVKSQTHVALNTLRQLSAQQAEPVVKGAGR
jgi:RNA polymerase sigma-70 factor (sigma-E family)